MTPAFWWGVLTGIGAAFVVSLGGTALVMAFLKGADMAEERVWTADDDDDFLRLARDINGEA